MKLGLIISGLILLVVTLIIVMALNTPPDKPTKKTSEAQLALQTLPTNLDLIVPPPPQGIGNAPGLYRKMVQDYMDNKYDLERRSPPSRLVNLVIEDLLAASHSAWSGDGFLDDMVPLAPGASPQFGAALELIPMMALERIKDSHSPAQIEEMANAVWNTGERAFTHGKRLYIRRQGLAMMQSAGSALYNVYKDDPDKLALLTKWADALGKIINVWDDKIQIIQSVKQPKGDLINIVKNDKDLSFRVAAMSWLGVAKFSPGHRGNERAIQALILNGQKSEDFDIAAAAKAADEFTVQDLRKLH